MIYIHIPKRHCFIKCVMLLEYFYTPKLKKACCCPKQCAEKECATMCCFKYPNTKTEEDDKESERPIDKFCQYKLRYYICIIFLYSMVIIVLLSSV